MNHGMKGSAPGETRTMDSQGGDSKQRSTDLDQLGCKGAVLIGSDNPSSKTQVPVKPRMPDTPSIGFHPDLQVPLLTPLRDWSDTEVRAIDVGCYDRNSSAGLPSLWDGEGQERALVSIRSKVDQRPAVDVRVTNPPGEEVLSTFLDILLPLIDLTDLTAKKATKN